MDIGAELKKAQNETRNAESQLYIWTEILKETRKHVQVLQELMSKAQEESKKLALTEVPDKTPVPVPEEKEPPSKKEPSNSTGSSSKEASK